MTVVQGRNVKKVYGGGKDFAQTTALNNVSIELERGDFTAVMGPSGSGKSTLLNILSGFDRPTSGDVFIQGSKMNEMTGDALAIFRRDHIGYIFQEFNLLDSLTIQQNIMLPMILNREESKQMNRKAEELMELLGILHIKNKYPYQVSGGQQQRAAVCRAVINNTSVIFADEPTGNLDSKSSKAVLECLKEMNQKFRTTILLVTHDPVAASFSDKVVFLKDGTLRAQLDHKKSQDIFIKQILDHLAVLEEGDYDV